MAFVNYGRWRMEQLSARQQALSLLGRPEHHQAQETGGFVLLAAGGTSAVFCLAGMLISSPQRADSDDEESRVSRGLAFGVLAGAVAAVGGLALLSQLKRQNAYRHEILSLEREHRHWARDIKHAHSRAPSEWHISFNLMHVRARF
jgi:hypothetical protein